MKAIKGNGRLRLSSEIGEASLLRDVRITPEASVAFCLEEVRVGGVMIFRGTIPIEHLPQVDVKSSERRLYLFAQIPANTQVSVVLRNLKPKSCRMQVYIRVNPEANNTTQKILELV